MGIPAGSVLKNLPANAGDARDTGLIPGSGRCPVVGNGNLDLQRADFVKGFYRIPSACHSGMSPVMVYTVELSHPANSAINTISLPYPSRKYHLTYVLFQGSVNYNPLWTFVWPMSRNDFLHI